MKLLHSAIITLFCWAPLVSGNPVWLAVLWYATWAVMTINLRKAIDAYVWEITITREQMYRVLYDTLRSRDAARAAGLADAKSEGHNASQ